MKKSGTVLFVDDGVWDCFSQLAVAVRRTGRRAVRVTIAPSLRSRAKAYARAILFDKTIVLSSPAELQSLGALVADEAIIDIQCVDTLLEAVVVALEPQTQRPRHDRWAKRVRAADKLDVASTLRAKGIRVPDVLAPPASAPADVAKALGLPLVVKPRVGSGGVGVEVVSSIERLEAVDKGLGADGLYEQFISGRALQYACFADEDGVHAFVTYETLLRKFALGPASLLATIDDPQLAAVGAGVVEALGISGFVNINVIRDECGRDWVHDVNPRVWGSFLVFRQMGVDFLDCYLDWLEPSGGVRRPQQARPAVTGVVFPTGIGTAAAGGEQGSRADSGRWSRPYLDLLGPRYMAFEYAKHGLVRCERMILRQEPLGGAPP